MKRRCPICGRFLKKENKYDACEYPRYCFEKLALKEANAGAWLAFRLIEEG